MLLAHKTSIKLNSKEANYIGHMCYASSKLWNICNYERRHYKEQNLPVDYPNWYYQKKTYKDNLWYKMLPSQTAQETLKLLDKAYKSFFALLKSGGILNPKEPRFKNSPMPITYMQKAVKHNGKNVRLTLSKNLKAYMEDTYCERIEYLYLENKVFETMSDIKQIKIYPPVNNISKIIVIYKIEDAEIKEDNGRYLSIDMGVNNLMTCYDNYNKESFIVGRKYQSISRYYYKEIGKVESVWYKAQNKAGIKYPKPSRHIEKLHIKKNNSLNDYLHKITRFIADYCRDNDINRVIVGDITNIREEKNFGKTNQKFHSLPYRKIYMMLSYKLNLYGIELVMQKEAYSSQTSPFQPKVNKECAEKSKRTRRGLYKDKGMIFNADSVGAYNILRLYLEKTKKDVPLDLKCLSSPSLIKVQM